MIKKDLALKIETEIIKYIKDKHAIEEKTCL